MMLAQVHYSEIHMGEFLKGNSVPEKVLQYYLMHMHFPCTFDSYKAYIAVKEK